MAKLLRLNDKMTKAVPAQCVVGRSASCTLVIDDNFASSEHARLTWTGGHWELRDLASRNGTFLDGNRLDPGMSYRVGAGAQIGFGEPTPSWEISDSAAPKAMAVNLETGEWLEAEGDILAVPNAEEPLITVYPGTISDSGWRLENDDGQVRDARSSEVLSLSGGAWRLELPGFSEQTPLVNISMNMENVSLRFEVSQDEERVHLIVILHGQETRLEAREHNYVLLTLARTRLAQDALSASERGWVSVKELSKMLRLEQNAINVAVCRARQQLSAIGLEGASQIVEVARGKRRFGTDRFTISVVDS